MDLGIKEQVRFNLALKASPVYTRKSSKWWKIAAAIAIPVLFCLSTYLYFSSGYNEVNETFVVFTEKGQKTQLVLPDGSQIYLNSGSKLSYNSGFNKNNRILKLEGEAFLMLHPIKKMLLPYKPIIWMLWFMERLLMYLPITMNLVCQ